MIAFIQRLFDVSSIIAYTTLAKTAQIIRHSIKKRINYLLNDFFMFKFGICYTISSSVSMIALNEHFDFNSEI